MTCPRCGVALESEPVHAVAVEVCRACGGLFLAHGELNRVAEATNGDLEYSTLHDEQFAHDDRFGPTICPHCPGATMKKVEFLVYTGIILDFCERCHGFWLDGHELERVNTEVHELNESARELGSPAMQWFAQFLFSLPR